MAETGPVMLLEADVVGGDTKTVEGHVAIGEDTSVVQSDHRSMHMQQGTRGSLTQDGGSAWTAWMHPAG